MHAKRQLVQQGLLACPDEDMYVSLLLGKGKKRDVTLKLIKSWVMPVKIKVLIEVQEQIAFKI